MPASPDFWRPLIAATNALIDALRWCIFKLTRLVLMLGGEPKPVNVRVTYVGPPPAGLDKKVRF